MFSYENRNLVSCFFCEYQFFTDGSTGENLDLDNCSPLCPTCGRAEDKELENSENIVDKDKTRRIIDKDKTKFAEANKKEEESNDILKPYPRQHDNQTDLEDLLD